MPLEKSDAIVLRAVEWSETSLVVTLWTRDFGKVSALAKGARRLRSPFESALDLLSVSSVVFITKSGDTLDILTEAKLSRRFRSGQRRLLPLYCGYYIAELLNAVTENHQPIGSLFELLETTLIDLDEGKNESSLVLRFELLMMRELGLLPSFEFCVGCGEEIERLPTVAFSVVGGGYACSRCSPLQRQVLRIQYETLETLSRVAERESCLELVELPTEARGEIRFVMEHVINHLVDRKLRLADFLQELKR